MRVCYLGEFGSERLVQKVVDSILAQSAAPLAASSAGTSDLQPLQDPLDTFDPEMASKIILTGQKVGHGCVWVFLHDCDAWHFVGLQCLWHKFCLSKDF